MDFQRRQGIPIFPRQKKIPKKSKYFSFLFQQESEKNFVKKKNSDKGLRSTTTKFIFLSQEFPDGEGEEFSEFAILTPMYKTEPEKYEI